MNAEATGRKQPYHLDCSRPLMTIERISLISDVKRGLCASSSLSNSLHFTCIGPDICPNAVVNSLSLQSTSIQIAAAVCFTPAPAVTRRQHKYSQLHPNCIYSPVQHTFHADQPQHAKRHAFGNAALRGPCSILDHSCTRCSRYRLVRIR
jgi:hypothetical protein